MRTCIRNRSSCASGSGKVPSCSIGFWVAITRNSCGRAWVWRPTVTWRSPIASSNADCTLAGARLISSASSSEWNTGPGTNSKRASCGRQISVPVRSAGSRSGVNCTRAKSASILAASARTALVLARPGAPSTSRWPSASSATSRRSTSSAWPTISAARSSRSAAKVACRRGISSREVSMGSGSRSVSPHWTRLPPPGSVPDGTFAANPRKRGRGPKAPSRGPAAGASALRDAHHLRGHEDQQLGLLPAAAAVLEQVTDDRQVAQGRDLGQVAAVAELVDATDRDGLAVLHQHRGRDLALVDLRHLAQARADAVEAFDLVLLQRHVEEHAAVVGDGRCDLQLEQHVLELDRRDAVALAAGDGEVTHLLALADDRFLLVAGHDARVRHHLAATLALQRRDLEVPVDVVAEDRERQRAAIGDRVGEVERVVEGDAALVVGVEHLAIGPLVAVDAARGDPAVEVVAAVDTEAGAEVAGERLVRDHDPGLDHHLVDRLVEGLDQALDLGHALRDVDREQGIGAAVEAQAAARGEKAAALAHATAGAAAAVAGLALFGEELDDV